MISENITLSQRRYDLDWLRVFAILTIFVFHSGRFFDQMDWHVKSAITYSSVQAWNMFLLSWIMPLFFIISGASLFYSVGKSNLLVFIKDKILRLLIPLLVGILTHISTNVYLERYTHSQFSGSFLEFYPHYFDGMYGFGGNFAWMGLHLWYLLVLFIYTLLLLPVFYLLKGPGRSFLDKLGNFLAIPGIILILMLPVSWLSIVFDDPQSIIGQRNMGGWPLPIYVCYFLYGSIIFSHKHLLESIQKMRWFYITIAFIAVGITFWLFDYAVPSNGTNFQQFILFGVIYLLGSWCIMLAFIGFACKHLTKNMPFLKYCNEAVLPFYIMHQTVLLIAGYFILQWPVNDAIKWIIISALSFSCIAILYEGFVRRFNVFRFLFGIKMLNKK